jgi:hypothetical protein
LCEKYKDVLREEKKEQQRSRQDKGKKKNVRKCILKTTVKIMKIGKGRTLLGPGKR